MSLLLNFPVPYLRYQRRDNSTRSRRGEVAVTIVPIVPVGVKPPNASTTLVDGYFVD